MNALVTVSCYATSAFLLYVLVHSGEVEGLTAFGKSNQDRENNRTASTPKERGKICNANSDCLGIGTTTCVVDKTDGKRHCLCKDSSIPINSKCAVVLSVPGKSCTNDAECILNAECTIHNETRRKLCTCKDGYSFDSDLDDSMCNGAMNSVFPSMVAMVTLALTVYVWTLGQNEDSS